MVKTAVAAALAWLAVVPVTDAYPYYAPLGAVIAVSTTVTDSMRGVAQAAVALALAAGLAFLVILLPVPTVVGLALVVGLGTLLAGWRWLGTMGSWVPVGGVFMLILGGDDPAHFMLAYVGLTFVGGLIGLAVNLAFPPLPLEPVARAQSRLRHEVAVLLDDVADALEGGRQVTAEEWERRDRALRPQLERVRRWEATVEESERVNWRASRWRRWTGYRQEQARSMVVLTELVVEAVSLLARPVAPAAGEPLAPELRPGIVAALRAVTRLVRAGDIHQDGGVEDLAEHARCAAVADRSLADLREQIHLVARDAGGDVITAASTVSALHRAIDALRMSPELAERLDAATSAEVDDPAPRAPAQDGERLPADAGD